MIDGHGTFLLEKARIPLNQLLVTVTKTWAIYVQFHLSQNVQHNLVLATDKQDIWPLPLSGRLQPMTN